MERSPRDICGVSINLRRTPFSKVVLQRLETGGSAAGYPAFSETFTVFVEGLSTLANDAIPDFVPEGNTDEPAGPAAEPPSSRPRACVVSRPGGGS